VSCGTLVLGISTAWLTSMCEFTGKKLFNWLLLLPMAMPAYIIAYTYTGMLEFAGPLQTSFRNWTGWGIKDYYFPEIRSMGGAILMFSFVLYPYIYLLARANFLHQSTKVVEVSRLLNSGPWNSFIKIALPLARPMIIVGLSLVIMETLADYGTVSYFGISVFTTGIFRTWFGLDDYQTAAKMAGLLLLVLLFLILLERLSRRKAQYFSHGGINPYCSKYKLKGLKSLGAFTACSIPLLFGFLIPATQLFFWALLTWRKALDFNFFQLVCNSLVLGVGAAFLALIFSLFFAYGQRIFPGILVKSAVRIVSLGYAIPGTVIAVGILVPFAWVDHNINTLLNLIFNITVGLIFSGSIIAVIFAYIVRFLSISLQTVESGLSKIKPSIDMASRSLGNSSQETFFRVHLPMMTNSSFTALLIVFVDVMKELPATLILRPFDFNTLAVRTFELASDERLADSSTSALSILIFGLLPVIYLSKLISKSHTN
jgi:iron(III) transport system permease protein